jgi:hypothetical protein
MPEQLASNPLMKMALAMRGSSAPIYGEATAGVGAGEISEVSISATEGVEVSGQLEVQGGSRPDGAAIARTRLALRALGGASTSVRTARPDGDGRFALRGVLPNRYAVSSMLADSKAQWLIRAVTANGRDVTHEPIVVEDKKIEVIVRLTNQVGTLRGRVRRASGQPRPADNVAGATLTAIVVPTNYTEWKDVEVAAERVRFTAVGADDSFQVGPLLAGEYLVAVVDERQIDLSRGLAALAQIASQSTRVMVGANTFTDVKVGIGGDGR